MIGERRDGEQDSGGARGKEEAFREVHTGSVSEMKAGVERFAKLRARIFWRLDREGRVLLAGVARRSAKRGR
jgi:hypothetical protein